MHNAPKTTKDPKAPETKPKFDPFGKEAETEEQLKIILKNNPALAKKYGIKL